MRELFTPRDTRSGPHQPRRHRRYLRSLAACARTPRAGTWEARVCWDGRSTSCRPQAAPRLVALPALTACTQLLPPLDEIRAVAGRVGRPRLCPDVLLTDRGYEHDKYRRLFCQRGIRPVIAKAGRPQGTGLGCARCF